MRLEEKYDYQELENLIVSKGEHHKRQCLTYRYEELLSQQNFREFSDKLCEKDKS